MTTSMKDLFKAIEQLKKYVGDYTYRTVYDYGTEILDDELQHPLREKYKHRRLRIYPMKNGTI